MRLRRYLAMALLAHAAAADRQLFEVLPEAKAFLRRAHTCTNSCSRVDDECDDGGEGAEFDLCQRGTDCIDCGTRAAVLPWGGAARALNRHQQAQYDRLASGRELSVISEGAPSSQHARNGTYNRVWAGYMGGVS
jgi:hypothetical protein